LGRVTRGWWLREKSGVTSKQVLDLSGNSIGTEGVQLVAGMFMAMTARKAPAKKVPDVRKAPAGSSDGSFAGFLHTLNLSRTQHRNPLALHCELSVV